MKLLKLFYLPVVAIAVAQYLIRRPEDADAHLLLKAFEVSNAPHGSDEFCLNSPIYGTEIQPSAPRAIGSNTQHKPTKKQEIYMSGPYLHETLQVYCEKLYGVTSEEMLHSVVSILLEGGAFTDAFVPETAPTRAKDHARVAQSVWMQVVEQNPAVLSYEAYVHEGIVDASPEIINHLLDLSFPSRIETLDWLRAITQIKHLRGSFFSEGFKGDVKINIARWQQDEAPTSAASATKTDAWQRTLYNLYASLAVVNKVDFPASYFSEDGHDKTVVIHGVVSPYLDSRIDFIAPVEHGHVKAYYLTNPRGIFNYEHLADILAASWFDDVELTSTIQTVLSKPEHKDCWLGNIAAVKSDILAVLGRDSWPEGRGAWYNANKPEGNIYQIAVEAEGNKRPSLRDWPVIEDLTNFLLEKKKAAHPGKFDNLSIEMVLTRVEGRVANTKDTLEYLRHVHSEILERGAIFISDNVSHNILKQDLEAVKVLGRSVVLATVGASSTVLDPKQARDAYAKIIFEHFGDVKQVLDARDAAVKIHASVTSPSFWAAEPSVVVENKLTSSYAPSV